MSSLIRKWIDGEGWQTVVDDGGGGGSFNGGTITEALVISPTDPAEAALVINASPSVVHASLTVGSGDASMLFTAVEPGVQGQLIRIAVGISEPNDPLSVEVVNAEILIALGADGGGQAVSTAAQVISAVNGNVDASALVTASLPPGTDGSDIPEAAGGAQLEGGDLPGIGVDIVPDANASLGAIVAQWRNAAGEVVGHFDNDGGGGMSADLITWAQDGTFVIDTNSPGAVSAPLTLKVHGASVFSVNSGGGYGTVIGGIDPDDRVLVVNAFTAQAANLIEVHDENDALVFRVGPSGNVLLQDSAGDQGISLSHLTGFRAFSALGDSVSFALDGGVSSHPFDPGSDALNLDGTELDPAEGAAMIMFVNPIGDMPDGFYTDNRLSINADLTHGAAKLLLKARDSTGSIVTAEIPLA